MPTIAFQKIRANVPELRFEFLYVSFIVQLYKTKCCCILRKVFLKKIIQFARARVCACIIETERSGMIWFAFCASRFDKMFMF